MVEDVALVDGGAVAVGEPDPDGDLLEGTLCRRGVGDRSLLDGAQGNLLINAGGVELLAVEPETHAAAHMPMVKVIVR